MPASAGIFHCIYAGCVVFSSERIPNRTIALKKSLPLPIRKFADEQPTLPINELVDGWTPRAKKPFPFDEYIYRLVGGMLLSGRVSPTQKDDLPHRQELERWCKESNFNPALARWIADFFIQGEVIVRRPIKNRYEPGENLAAIENRDLAVAKKAFLGAFYRFITRETPRGVRRWTDSHSAGFEGFLRAFAKTFHGRAFPEDQFGEIAREFSLLPCEILEKAGGEDGENRADNIADKSWFEVLFSPKANQPGKLEIHGCRALIRPENEEVLEAIRKHRRLKGYLSPMAPPGFLIIKDNSNPNNFITRCRECGFEVSVI